MEPIKILIVEDEAIIAMEIKHYLRNLGYEVTAIVDTGEKAMQESRQNRPDLVLMDIHIKGDMDGIEVAVLIREQLEIPVVFSTAYLDEERIGRAKITMPFGYVLKPIQERDLKVTLEMALYVAKVDAERRKSEFLFYQLFSQSKTSTQLFDADGTCIMVNPVFCELFGVKAEQITDGRVSVFQDQATIESGSMPLVREIFDKKKTHNWSISFDTVIVSNSAGSSSSKKEKIWIDILGYPILDSNNNLEYVILQHYDITERKQAEIRIEKINERFNLATHAANIGIWDWDIQKNELVWDDHMYQLYGVDRKEFSGAYKAWLNGIHPDDIERCNRESEQVRLQGIEYNTEFRIVWPGGTIRHIKAHGEVFKDENGNPIRMIGINYDITREKQTKQRLQDSEASLRSLIENIDCSFWSVDRQYHLMEANSAFLKQIKQGIQRELKKGDNVFLGQPGTIQKEWKGYYDRAFAGERFVINTQSRFTPKPVYTQYRFNPIKTDAQTIIGATVFRYDSEIVEDKKKTG